MGSGGMTVFWGKPSEAINFMEQQSGHKFLKGANPFEYLIECIQSEPLLDNDGMSEADSVGLGPSPDDGCVSQADSSSMARRTIEHLADAFADSQASTKLLAQVEEDIRGPAELEALPMAQRNRIDETEQVKLLVSRAFRHVSRDPSLLLLYNAITIAVALLSAFTFYNLGVDIAGTQNRVR